MKSILFVVVFAIGIFAWKDTWAPGFSMLSVVMGVKMFTSDIKAEEAGNSKGMIGGFGFAFTLIGAIVLFISLNNLKII
jgi:hypothetical protein